MGDEWWDLAALWLAGFRRVDLRPHVVGSFDVTAGEVEKLAVSRMVRLLHALDMRPDRGMLLGSGIWRKNPSPAPGQQ